MQLKTGSFCQQSLPQAAAARPAVRLLHQLDAVGAYKELVEICLRSTGPSHTLISDVWASCVGCNCLKYCTGKGSRGRGGDGRVPVALL
jgi:hypothetical protein